MNINDSNPAAPTSGGGVEGDATPGVSEGDQKSKGRECY